MPTACILVPSPQHAYPGHSEGPERFSGLRNWQSRPYAKALLWLEPHPAGSAEVRAVHSERMLHDLAEVCKQGPGIIDFAPTYVTPSSFDDALATAGGTLACSRAVLDGTAHNAFALVRPPGHHAEPDRPMGFCLLNNLAIAAADALAHGIRKILIFDFDAHHGNGTQAAFWGRRAPPISRPTRRTSIRAVGSSRRPRTPAVGSSTCRCRRAAGMPPSPWSPGRCWRPWSGVSRRR